MKKVFWKMILLVLCLYLFFNPVIHGEAQAETPKWTCTNCGQPVNGNYCASCGTKAENEEPMYIDGDWLLNLEISNDKNIILAKYDIDIYLDGIRLSTISHGEAYSTTVKVSKGIHTVCFAQSDNMTVSGTSKFRVLSPDTDYRCSIKSKTRSIDIHDETLNGSKIDHEEIDRELFILESKDADYERYVRYPSVYTGKKTKLVGKAVAILSNPLVGSIMEVSDWRGNIWIVKYRNNENVARILPGDTVECYGEYKGVSTDSILYSMVMKFNESFPIIAVSYYSIR